MDFMKWLGSLDEFLYEVMSWLVFFPVTAWRTLTRPLSMMTYAERQLALPEAEQYSDAISPPLFLALALALSHGFATALGETDVIVARRQGLSGLVNDDTSALILRLVLFAIFPLINTIVLVRGRGLALDRNSLRVPFYAQCYPASVFALGISVATTLATLPHHRDSVVAGLAIWAVSIFYFLAAQTRWYRSELGGGTVRALVRAITGLIVPFALFLLIGTLFAR